MAKLTDSEITGKVLRFIRDSRQHTIVRNQEDRAELYQDFFRGGSHQWTEEDYNVYKSRGVDPITINRCKPALKGLLGMYLQSRQEIRIRPRRGGSATTAQVHTEITKHTQDVSNADYVYSQVFMRGGIDTEAYLKLEIDRGQNVNGQPVIKGRSIWDIDVDRNAIEYNLDETAAYVIERMWKDKDEINALYPDKENIISNATASLDAIHTTDRMAERLATFATSDAGMTDDRDETEQIPDLDLLKQYRYLMHNVYWKEIIPALIVSDTQNQTTVVVTDERQVAKLNRKGKKSKRFVITNYAQKKLHETVFLGQTMLEDKPEPLGPGVSDYPIVRYSPIWDQGYAIGALDDIIGLNREENIHRTQTIRLLNQTANSGWITGSEPHGEYKNVLKNFGSVPGIILPLDKFGGRLDKIKPNQLSAGHYTMANQFELDIKRVSGIDDASQGLETGKNESGRAIGLKQRANRSSNEIMFDNFYWTLTIFGNLLLKVQLANKHYTDDEIKAIVSESSLIDTKMMALARHRLTTKLGADLPQPQVLPPITPETLAFIKPEDKLSAMAEIRQGAQGANDYAKAYPQLAVSFEAVVKADAIEMLLDQLREDKGMYGVKVTVSPSSPTERMSQFLQIDALMSKYGQLIPIDVLVDVMDLPEVTREEIKAKVASAQQAQPQQQPVARGAA